MDAHCPLAGVQGGPLYLFVKKIIRLFFVELFQCLNLPTAALLNFQRPVFLGKQLRCLSGAAEAAIS